MSGSFVVYFILLFYSYRLTRLHVVSVYWVVEKGELIKDKKIHGTDNNINFWYSDDPLKKKARRYPVHI